MPRKIILFYFLALLVLLSTSKECNLQGCQKCKQKPLQCEICRDGLILGPRGRCIAKVPQLIARRVLGQTSGNYTCTIENCQACQPANNCTSCVSGYKLTSSNTCISCPDANCKTCTQANICDACQDSYDISSSGSSCILCNRTKLNMENCLSCNQTDSCGQCANGYQVFSAGGFRICLKCNIQNCKTCGLSNSVTVCSECFSGYSPNGGSCNQCLFPCASCNSGQAPNNCLTCSTPSYFATALSNGTCVKNSIPNCLNYSSTNVSLCGQCAVGYQLTNDSSACNFICPENCQACSSSTVCTTCIEGYLATSNGTCGRCQISGCSECQSDLQTCKTCFTGFYLLSKECKMCPSYCKDCSSASTCNELAESKSQVLIKVGQSVVLAVCKSTCQSCSSANPEICLQCIDGFYLRDSKCFRCSSSCLTCDSTSSTKCLSCYANNYLVNDTCLTCNDNCLSCEGATNLNKCTSCREGYYLNSDGTCGQGCPTNCITCSNLTTCTRCSTGFTLFSHSSGVRCLQCISSCRACADGKPATCLTCGSGFYLSGSTCKACSTNCQQCTAGVCNSCVDGFFLTSTFSCAKNCIAPCATCSASDPTKCLSCVAGYSFNDQTQVCTGVTSCSGGCVVCPFGYSLNQGLCQKCPKSNCQSCNVTNPTQCYSCNDNYYLNSSGECAACDKSCQRCIGSGGCLVCADGYTTYESAPATANGLQCVACTSPCKSCRLSPEYCTACIDGYIFRGWKCARQFSFSVGMTLTTTLILFYENYENFLLAIAKAMGSSDSRKVTVRNVKEGSVVADINADPVGDPGTSDAKSQLTALMDLIKEGSSIGGLPVASSSVVVQGDSTGSTTTTPLTAGSESSSSNNIGLILGVVIPLGVLLLAGTVIVVKRLVDNRKEYEEKRSESNSYTDDRMYKSQEQKNDII